METNKQTNAPSREIGFFNLNKDGDTADIRLLCSSVKNIEVGDIHWIQEGGKKRLVKCNGQECPICKTGNQPIHRIFVHLFDFTDHKEKVWSRTDKILPQLQEVEESWGDLSKCILRITRQGDNFPRYTITPLNPSNYPPLPYNLQEGVINAKISYRCYSTRSNEELSDYLKTGILPQHKKVEFISKEAYKNASVSQPSGVHSSSSANDVPFDVSGSVTPPSASVKESVSTSTTFADDPFSIFAPRKV